MMNLLRKVGEFSGQKCNFNGHENNKRLMEHGTEQRCGVGKVLGIVCWNGSGNGNHMAPNTRTPAHSCSCHKGAWLLCPAWESVEKSGKVGKTLVEQGTFDPK